MAASRKAYPGRRRGDVEKGGKMPPFCVPFHFVDDMKE